MKKSKSFDLSQPTRQSYAAILIIMYRLYRVIIRQLLPVAVIILLQGKLDKSGWFLYPIITIAVIGAAYSILAFFRYYFYLEKDKLIVKKGVLKRSTLEIPFDRIQSVNFEQNLIHRLFSVVKLNMDTAGSTGNELQLYALNRDMASQLSELILQSIKSKKKSLDISENKTTPVDSRKQIFGLSIGQLLKVGITENHIRSGGIIVFFLFYIWDSLEDFGVDLIEKGEQYMPVAQQLVQSMAIVIVLVILFSIIAFTISMVRTVLNYYDLKMYRKGHGFVVVSGLLNKNERAAKDEKVQILKSSQNLLQSWAGIYELVFKQASSAQASEAKSIKSIGLSKENLFEAEAYLLKKNHNESRSLKMKGVDFYFLYKRLFYWTSLMIALTIFFVYNNKIDTLVISLLLYSLAIYASYLAYKKKRYAWGSNIFRLDAGVFGRSRQVVENHKIQNIHLKETPFQRRRGLSTVELHTASGVLTVPDIKRHDAYSMKNYLLYKVESSKKKWM
ncbi:MAG: PH domain-containing protein [Saprospiraceae bacterium]|jgi:putative membrane protein